MKNRIIAVITKIIIFIFALVSGINAAPASINSLHFYTSSSFTDSSITAVTIGSSFYIMADTDAPTAPKIPPDTFLVVITHDSNPFDTVYITLTQDATDSRLYKSEKIEIVANGLSNSQLNQIGVLENSGEYIRTFYNNIEYDSLVVAISQQPSALNNLNFMSAGYTEILTGNVIQNSILYIEANGVDANPITIDTLAIYCRASQDANGISLILRETAANTGKFHGTLQLSSFSDTDLQAIKAYLVGDTIEIFVNYGILFYDTVMIAGAVQPAQVLSIDFKNSSYTSSLNRNALPTEIAYIEATATDANSLTADSMPVFLVNLTNGDSILFYLFETNSNSGKFRGIAEFSSFSNSTQKKLKTNYGDTIIVYSTISANIVDTIIITIPRAPSFLNNLQFMSANYSEILTGNVIANTLLYIEANGLDSNELTIDTFAITCTSTIDNVGITLVLTETAVNSGKYRGTLQLSNFSNAELKTLNAYNNGDIIFITNSITPNAYDTVAIQSSTIPSTILTIDFQENGHLTSLTRSVLPDEILYIEIIAIDANPYTSDTLNIYLVNTRSNDSIVINAIETNSSSGKFRGTAQLGAVTNQTLNILAATFGDTIICMQTITPSVQDTIFVTIPLSPIVIQSLTFKNSNYTSNLGDYTAAYTKLYIEATAIDRNQYYQDTLSIICRSTYDTIYITLIETAKNSGIFRGFVELNNFSYQTLNYIKAYQNGETIVISASDKYDTITIFNSAAPSNIISINVKTDNTYLINNTREYTVDDYVFVEVVADDVNPLTIDKIEMQAYSSSTPNDKINFYLTETQINSGRFQGKFKLTTLSNDTIDELKAIYGDTVYITVKNSINNTDTIQIKITIPRSPTDYNELRFKEANYTTNWKSYNQVTYGDNVYISLTATDMNELSIDTCGVILMAVMNTGDTNFNDSQNTMINLTLTETGKHTGVYRGSITLSDATSLLENKMKLITASKILLVFGDTPTYQITPAEYNYLLTKTADTLYTAVYLPPTAFSSITLKEANYTQIKLSPIKLGDFMYIEIIADKNTSSNLLADTIKISVQSTTEKAVDSQDTIWELVETDKHSGIYRTAIYVIDINEAGIQLGGRVEATKGDWIEIKVLHPNTLQPITNPPVELKREVAYEITPDRLKEIKVFRDSGYSNLISNNKLSYEAPFNYLYIQAEAYDLQATSETYPYANDMLRDTVNVVISSIDANDSIVITLIETSENSNIYRNWVAAPVIKSIVINKFEGRSELEANRPDTIIIYGLVDNIVNSAPVTLYVENYQSPADQYVSSLKFYTGSDFSTELNADLISGDFLYVKLTALENASAAVLQDTKLITIHRNLNPLTGISQDSINVLLTEISVGSEDYRVVSPTPMPRIYNFTDKGNNYLLGLPGDVISLTLYNDTVIRAAASVGIPQSPYIITTVNAYKDNSYSAIINNYGEVEYDNIIYLEAIGDFGNSVIRDTTAIKITNISKPDSDFIIITLTESSKNSGKYYGNFKITKFTNFVKSELGCNEGDILKIEIFDVNCDTTAISPYPRYLQIAMPKPPNTLYSLKFMTQNYADELIGNITSGFTLYVEARGADASELTIDTILCRAYSTEDTSGIYFNLTETEKNSGIYRSSFSIANYTDAVNKILKANNNGTIIYIEAVSSNGNDTKVDTVAIQSATPPNNIIYATFKADNYQAELNEEILPNATLYLEIVANDLNSHTADTLLAYLVNSNISSNNPACSIPVILYETNKNSGIFRNTAFLGSITNRTTRTLQATYGNIIILISADKSDSITVTTFRSPNVITSMRLMNSNYTNTLTTLDTNFLYVEIYAEDANSLTADTVLCYAFSTYLAEQNAISFELSETSNNSGIFRGFFGYGAETNDALDIIKAIKTGDTIFITITDPATNYKFYDMVTIYATYFYLNPISYNDTTTYSINKNFLTLSGLIGSPQTTNMLYLYNSETGNTTTIGTFTTTQDFSHTVYFQTNGYKILILTAKTLNDALPETTQTIIVNIDNTPPNLLIIQPFNNQTFSDSSIILKARLNHNLCPDTAIVIVNNTNTYNIYFDAIDTKLFYSNIIIPLENSANTIAVIASDFLGNTTAQTINVYYKKNYNIINLIIDPRQQNINIPSTFDVYNITFADSFSNDVRDTAKITLSGDDNLKITLNLQFKNPAAPVSLIIKNYNNSEVQNKINTANTTHPALIYGDNADFVAGLKTIREFSFTCNGLAYNDTENFNNILLTYELPERFKGANAVSLYYLNESQNKWQKLDDALITLTDDILIAQIKHFSIYGVFLSGLPFQKNLENVVIYPNPFRPNDNNPLTGSDYSTAINNSGIHIYGLTGNNTIEIYNLLGELVFSANTNAPKVIWDAKNRKGQAVSSGLYFVLIKDAKGNKVVKKLTIIR